MLTKRELEQLIDQERIASARVVPVPLEAAWCIDVVIRNPLTVGSQTRNVASGSGDKPGAALRKFPSIDSAAAFLREVGLSTFVVDIDDAVSFTEVDAPGVHVVDAEMTEPAADQDDDGEPRRDAPSRRTDSASRQAA